MIFALSLIEKQWTKRDAFILLECDNTLFTDTNQMMASFILVKRSEKSIEFFKQYLKYSQDYRILTDVKNTLGLNNYPEFIDHRHDQSILSLLSKKWGLIPFHDPSQTGILFDPYIYYLRREVPKSDYPMIIIHTRKSNLFHYFFTFLCIDIPRYKIKFALKYLLESIGKSNFEWIKRINNSSNIKKK